VIESALCLLFFIIALPVSRGIAAHYFVFFAVNIAFIGIEYADSSLLTMTFTSLVVADCLIVLYSKHYVLMVSALISFALALESVANGDWLLNQSIYLSIATNAVIAGSLIEEYRAWMRGRSERC
jgi:hypothetical protein